MGVAARRRSDGPFTPDLFDPGARDRARPADGTDRPASGPSLLALDPAPGPPEAPEVVRDRETEPDAFFDQPFREIEHGPGGLHLTDSVLWFDADRRRELSFISSAHADFVGKNRRILATEETVKILTRGSGRIEALTSPYRRSFALGPLELEMHPAGRMLGAAQLLVQRDGRRILYTNDFITHRLSTSERAKPVPCDVLAMPATYGRRDFRFPAREEVLEAIVGFVDRSFEDKHTPVLIASPLGVAQELMYVLGKRGLRVRAHRSMHDVAKVYSELGVNLLSAKRLQGKPARDEVVLVPPILRHATAIKKLERHRTALVSGRAIEPDHVFHLRVDEAFALGEAADHADLVTFAEACGAEEVYLTSGYVQELAADLRERGHRVYPLVRPEQLPLL